MADLTPESLQRPDRDTRDLAPKPKSDFEEAIALVRASIFAAHGTGSRHLQLALIALDIVAGPGRAVEILEAAESLFTFRRDGLVHLDVQDEKLERVHAVTGATLREAVNAAAHCVTLEKRRKELEE